MSVEVLITVGSITIVGAYIALVSRLLKRIFERRSQAKKAFYSALIAGFNSENITSLEDIKNLFKGSSGTSIIEAETGSRFSMWLREFIVDLIAEKTEVNQSNIGTTKEFLSKALDEHERQSPFANLPELERNILNDVDEFVSASNPDSARRKLQELTTAIVAREEELSSLRSSNKWSVPLAIAGVILTVIFGIVSIVLGLS
jgi:hypothetical protein